MKKALLIAASISAFLCLFTIAFQWYFNPSRSPEKAKMEILARALANREEVYRETIEKHIPNLDDSNAAKYYLKACLTLAHPPDDDPVWERFTKVYANGLQAEDPELEDFINKNEPAFDLVRKGIKQKRCSLPTEGALEGNSYLSDFRHIARLFIVKARFFQKREEYDSARKTYVNLLRFSRDVSDNGAFIHILSGHAMEGMAYNVLDSYLRGLEDATVCQRFLDDLIDIGENRASLHDLLENEFAFSRRMVEGYMEDFLYFRDPDKDPTVIGYFLDTLVKVSGYLWFRLALPKKLKEMDTFHQVILDISTKSYPEIVTSHLEEKIPDDELSQMMFKPIYRAMFAITRYDVIRRASTIRVALHLFLLRNGEYPGSLEELAPVVPEHILTDPFSTKRFPYKNTEAGYQLYSFGPDLDDDGGKRFEKGMGMAGDYDMVFEVPDPSVSSPAST